MICKYCEAEMFLDDVDFNFPGCKDNYWLCPKCHSAAFEKIRYGKTWDVHFESAEDDSRDATPFF